MPLTETFLASYKRNKGKNQKTGRQYSCSDVAYTWIQAHTKVYSSEADLLNGYFYMYFIVASGIGELNENKPVSSFMYIYIHLGFRESWGKI